MTEPAPPDLSNISKPLRPFAVPLDSISPDPSNARSHSNRNIEVIRGSLRKFGQQKPIVVNAKDIIVAGNGTYEAAVSLEWTHIAVVRTGLEGIDQAAYAVADNRSGELADWHEGRLNAALAAIRATDGFDPTVTGFTDEEITDMIGEIGEPGDEPDPNAVPQPPDEAITKPGDLYILGRVACCPKCGRTTDV